MWLLPFNGHHRVTVWALSIPAYRMCLHVCTYYHTLTRPQVHLNEATNGRRRRSKKSAPSDHNQCHPYLTHYTLHNIRKLKIARARTRSRAQNQLTNNKFLIQINISFVTCICRVAPTKFSFMWHMQQTNEMHCKNPTLCACVCVCCVCRSTARR